MQNRYEEISGGQKFVSEEKSRRKLDTAIGNVIARRYESVNYRGAFSYTVQVPLSQTYSDELSAYDDPNIALFSSLTGGRNHINDDKSGAHIIRTLSRNDKVYAIEFRVLPDKVDSLPDASPEERRVFKTEDRLLADLCKECIRLGGEKPRDIARG